MTDKTDMKEIIRISDSKTRAKIALELVEEDASLNFLVDWIHEDVKLANRCMWLLSDIGALDKDRLLKLIPALFELKDKISHVSISNQLARYFMITGIPEEMEDEAADHLFSMIKNSNTTPHYKYSAQKALEPLLEKYPDLKNELQQIN